MAFSFDDKEIKDVELIPRVDSAITKPENYDDYILSFADYQDRGQGDETLLGLKEGDKPTYFVMKGEMSWRATQALRKRNMQMSPSLEDGQVNVKVNPNFQAELVRSVFIDIKYPDSVPANKRIPIRIDKGDKMLDHGLTAKLDRMGLISDMAIAYRLATENSAKKAVEEAAELKNS